MATIESYSRGELVNAVLQDKVDWAPTSDTTLMAKIHRQLNRRLLRMATSRNNAAFEKQSRLVWHADYKTGLVDVEPTDAHVWRLPAVGANAGVWNTAGLWAGFHLEVFNASDVRFDYPILEVWLDLGTNYYYLTTPVAHQNTTDAALTYRIYQPGLWLPQEMVTLQSLRPYRADGRYAGIQPIPVFEAEQTGALDWKGESTGTVPRVAWRGERQKLQDPRRAPTVTLDENTPWVGPEPAGAFSFLVTYILGNEDHAVDWPQSVDWPRFESAPSPASGSTTVAYGGSSPVITTPEIEWMTGFNRAGTFRAGRGGIKKRIWAARTTATGGTHTTIETPDVYEHLVDIDGATTAYTWNGSISPNYWVRHRTSHGRQLIHFDPRPDSRVEFLLRAVMRPKPLLHDNDAAEMSVEAQEVLLDGLAADVWGMIGNTTERDKAEKRFEDGLGRLQATQADMGPHTQHARTMARALPGGGGRIIPAQYRG